MSDHSKYRLGELVTLKRGYDLPHASRTPGDFPIVSSSGITGNHKEPMVKGPGVVTGRYGTLGEVFYIPGAYWPLNTSLYVQNFKGNDPRFVAYYLRTVLSANFNSAGAVPGVNRNVLHKLAIPLPPKDQETQRKIAAILTAYDDLIETNKRRIALLDKMAEELYREWFVRMRFPGHQNTKTIKGIPEGWEVNRLDQLAMFENGDRGKNYPQSADFVDTGIPFINAGHLVGGSVDIRHVNRITEASFSRISSGKIQPGDLLLCIRGSLGRLARVGIATQGAIASSLVIIRASDRCDISYLFYLLSGERGRQLVDELDNGVAQPNISVQSLKRSLVLFPPIELLKHFGTLIQPVWQMVSHLRCQSENLQDARELLLPRLISGKLLVEDLDIQFPPSMREEGTEPEPGHA